MALQYPQPFPITYVGVACRDESRPATKQTSLSVISLRTPLPFAGRHEGGDLNLSLPPRTPRPQSLLRSDANAMVSSSTTTTTTIRTDILSRTPVKHEKDH